MTFRDTTRVMLPPQTVDGNTIPSHMTSEGSYGNMRKSGPHGGVDINYEGGQNLPLNQSDPAVYSPVSGTVESVGGKWGMVGIRDANGYLHEILHLSDTSVKKGQHIDAGTQIGNMGKTNTKAYHVHYQMRAPGKTKGTIDPEKFWDDQVPDAVKKPNTPSAPIPQRRGSGILPQWVRDLISPTACTPKDMNGNGIPDSFEKALTKLYDKLQEAMRRGGDGLMKIIRYDPLVLDLNGDGIETVAAAGTAGAMFDLNNDGIRTATGWVNSNDGILVRDINGNGIIDNGTEVFGDSTALANGSNATNGFSALSDMDSNGDGVVDAQDANFAQLQVWRDLNQDGISTADELFTLQQAGVQSLNTSIAGIPNAALAGGIQAQTGSFTRSDGTVGAMADINLTQDTFHSRYIDQITIPAALQSLPNFTGVGRLRDLQQAAALSPALADALTQYTAATTSTQRKALLDNVLTEWAKTDPLYSDSTILVYYEAPPTYYLRWWETPPAWNPTGIAAGQALSNKIHLMDAIRGVAPTTALHTADGSDPTQGITEAYNMVITAFFDSLEQIRLQPLFDQINIVFDFNGFTLDLTDVQASLESSIANDAASGMSDLFSFNKIVSENNLLQDTDWGSRQQTIFQNTLETAAMTPALQGVLLDSGYTTVLAQADVPTEGTATNDVLLGTAQNDILNGGEGNDILLGKAGDDILDGGAGNDTITDSVGNNTLKGGAGDDIITGRGIFEGGTGNDTLVGSNDNDTYLFNLGDGQDILLDHGGAQDAIQFGIGIDPASVSLSHSGDDLVFNISPTDQITVKNWFVNNDYRLEAFHFSDGTIWDAAQVKDMTINYNGTTADDNIVGWESNDNINGLEGNDIIDGGAGNDIITDTVGNNTLKGGAGDDSITGHGILEGGTGNDTLIGSGSSYYTDNGDTYVFNAGDGKDTILDYGTNHWYYVNYLNAKDVIQFGAGIDPASISLSHSGDDLVFNISATDQITVKNWFVSSDYYIEEFRFADGTVWDQTQVQNMMVSYNATAGDDVIAGWSSNDIINGLDGNDTIDGGAGNDVIDGGNGNDIITDTVGNNTLKGGAGDDSITGKGIIEGGIGNDTLVGSSGDFYTDNGNTYVFNAGDGKDTILDYGTNHWYYVNYLNAKDVIQFGTGIDPASISLSHNGDDLVFNISATDQITVKNWFVSSDYYIEEFRFADGTVWDQTQVQNMVVSYNGTAADDNVVGWGSNDIINTFAGDDTVNGGAGNDVIDGGNGNDIITDTLGNNTLKGGAGDDTITGHGIIEGGTGNDTLVGSGGSYYTDNGDTYVFNLGDGQDTILDYGTNHWYYVNYLNAKDVVQFGTGIDPASVSLSHSGDDLVFNISPTDQITVKNWFVSSDYYIEEFRFADGTVWDQTQVQNMMVSYNGTAGDDVISGWSSNDIINALDGNDTINGGAGNDAIDGGNGNDIITDTLGNNTLKGGAGDDTITGHGIFEGGTGNDTLVSSGSSYWTDNGDTYVFNLGDGQDTILDYGTNHWYYVNYLNAKDVVQFGTGIDPASVSLSHSGDDLVFNISATDQITVKNWFVSSDYYIEEFRFADGTVWDQTHVQNMVVSYNGTSTDDVITGWSSNDILNALDGNDTINGGAGNDVIDGGTGNDIITDTLGNNTLKGGAGDDTITGRGIFEGGTGNDTLVASGSDYWTNNGDTYVFNLGDGKDTILDYGTNHWYYVNYLNAKDVVQFGTGIDPNLVSLSHSGDDLVFNIEQSDQITVKNWFVSSDYYIEEFRFADGTVWDQTHVQNMMVSYNATASDDVISGWSSNDIISGLDGNDVIDGGAGSDIIDGGNGNDIITDTLGNNTLKGGAGDDTITGRGIFEGGIGNDTLVASGSDYWTNNGDTYVFNLGDGKDTILDYGTNHWYYVNYLNAKDVVQFGTGIDPASISLSHNGDDLVFNISATDQITVKNWFVSSDCYIEEFRFADGTIWDQTQVQNMVVSYNGTAADDSITGVSINNIINGLDGNDILNGGVGVNLLDGGAGTDTLTGNAAAELFIGGTGNDTITTGNGTDIIAFNRGDGMDVVNGGIGTDNTLSLGKGISYTDLALSKVNNDLIVEVGAGEQITLANWYNTTANYQSVLDLQVMADAIAGFNASSTDPLLNQAVQNFNFTTLVANFDQARGSSATFQHWNMTNSLLAARLSGSDTLALGGDLAHQYGTMGTLTGMNLAAAQTALNTPNFGSQAQTLRPLQGLQGGGVTL